MPHVMLTVPDVMLMSSFVLYSNLHQSDVRWRLDVVIRIKLSCLNSQDQSMLFHIDFNICFYI